MNEWQGKKFEDEFFPSPDVEWGVDEECVRVDITQEGLGDEPDQVSLTLETLEAIVAWVKERHNA